MSSPALQGGAPRPPTPQAGHLNKARRPEPPSKPSPSPASYRTQESIGGVVVDSDNRSGFRFSSFSSSVGCFLPLCRAVEVVRLGEGKVQIIPKLLQTIFQIQIAPEKQ